MEKTEALNKQLEQLKVKVHSSSAPKGSEEQGAVAAEGLCSQDTVIEREESVSLESEEKNEHIVKLESRVQELQREVEDLRNPRISEEESVSS